MALALRLLMLRAVALALRVKIRLKNDHCCDLINVFPALPPVQTHFLQMLLSRETGQSLIAKDDRNLSGVMKFPGKLRDFPALRTGTAIHMQWFADYNFMNFVFLDYLPESVKVGLQIAPLNGWPSLSRKEHGVAHCNTDEFIAYIQAHDPHVSRRLRPVGLALRPLRSCIDGCALTGSHSLRS